MSAWRGSPEPVSYAVVRQLRSEVAERLTSERSVRTRERREPLSVVDEQYLAQKLIAGAVEKHVAQQVAQNLGVPEGAEDGRLATAVQAAMFGAGPLQPLLDDEDLENVDFNGYDRVWATYASRGRVRLPDLVESDEELIEVFRALATHAGVSARPWSVVHPQLDLGLPGGTRVSGLLAASARPQISIRRDRLGPQAFLDQAPRRLVDTISLTGLGTLDRQMAAFLTAAVRARANILVAGPTNGGKTTLLRALTNAVDAQERLITIEQALELRLGRDTSLHGDVVELETVLASPEGKGGLDGADLVRRSKRMNPDRLIFGEVLHGPEMRAMLEAMLQGGDGSMSTIHSRDAHGAMTRLIMGLGALAEPVPPATAAALIGQAVDFVVYVQKVPNGRRLVTEILEISGNQGETVSCSTIFASPPSPVSAVSAVSGVDETEVAAARADRERRAGQPVDASWMRPARRDPRIPLRRADLLARHGYTDELGEQLNAEAPRRRSRTGRPVTGTGTAYRDAPVGAETSGRSRRTSGDGYPRYPSHPRYPGYSPAGVDASDVTYGAGRVAETPEASSPWPVGRVPGQADPAAIPRLHLDDRPDPARTGELPLSPASQFDVTSNTSDTGDTGGTGTADGSDHAGHARRASTAEIPDEVTMRSLDLPDDGRGHSALPPRRHRSEPLTQTPWEGIRATAPTAPASVLFPGADLPDGAEPTGLTEWPEPAESAESAEVGWSASGSLPVFAEIPGPATGPIIDLGARRAPTAHLPHPDGESRSGPGRRRREQPGRAARRSSGRTSGTAASTAGSTTPGTPGTPGTPATARPVTRPQTPRREEAFVPEWKTIGLPEETS